MSKTETAIKLKSITARWLANVLPVVVLVIVLCEVCVGIALFNYFERRVADTSLEYVEDINVLSTVPESEFSAKAREYAGGFDHRDKVEVQIFSVSGELIATTNGFEPSGLYAGADDLDSVLKTGRESVWYGKNRNGEKVLAMSLLLPDYGYGSNGAYRVLVSMEDSIYGFYTIFGFALAVGVVALTFFLLTGFYFVKSIVRPVREVTATARKIAGGDMKSRIDVRQNNEIGELCDTINYMASELEHADTVKNDFISAVSHELRTPLTAITGWGETVKMSIGEDDEIVRHGVDVILGEAGRLKGLVEDLLDFSRLESGKLTVTPVPCDLVELVSSVTDMYEEIAKQQKLELVFVKPQTSAKVMADRDRIKQVFINILDNAVKYSEAGGHIVISAFSEEGCMRITVSDTGCGIPNKDLDHVKEKFYKANTKVRGSGIGLAVADEIVRNHNGLLLVESTEGKGTTVTVVLPTVAPSGNEITEVIYPPRQKGN